MDLTKRESHGGDRSLAHQLDVWRGQFGRDYTDRNIVDWRLRLRAFRQALGGLHIWRVLEVGCNRAHNLEAIAHLLELDAELVGVEPNRHAAELARASATKATVLLGNAFNLPIRDSSFDLVFTAGVLIHIPSDHLPLALSEMFRVSRRYVLAIEYFASRETQVSYRGHDDLLWKRDYLALFRSQFPDAALRQSGSWGRDQGFDRTSWWLLEKASRS